MDKIFYIIDNIYLSNLYNASNINNILKNNINIVIRLSEDKNESPYDKNILFYNFELEDNLLYKKQIIEFSKEIYNIILNNENKNILIHCNEGQSRSVSAIIYYLCTKYKWEYFKAYDYIKNIKSDIRPNNSFIYELRKLFDSKLFIPEDKAINKIKLLDELKIYDNQILFDDEEYKNECLKMLLSK